jgi:hypothetical protein
VEETPSTGGPYVDAIQLSASFIASGANVVVFIV